MILLCASLFISSCAGLPEIRPARGPAASALQAGCEIPFPDGKWQFVHSIEAELPGGRKGFVVGVTVISSMPQTTDCAIMSLEGFVFFNAGQDREIVIHRAIFPFDKKEFAQGLMQDIRLMFFKPDGPLIESGVLENDSSVCRYQSPGGKVIDIITSPDNNWEIRQYSEALRLTRTIKAWSLKNEGPSDKWPIPGRLELTAHGSLGYKLTMTLVDAVLLTQ